MRKRLAHRLKSALYTRAGLDAACEDLLGDAAPRRGVRAWLRENAYLRLLPERRIRESPFETGVAITSGAPSILILTLVPPEDTGGGSRPAQLAAEFRRRGFAIDWRYALPIFPWPRTQRPRVPGVEVRHSSEPDRRSAAASPGNLPVLALLEAPHPALAGIAAELPPRVPLIYDAIDAWEGSLAAGWYEPTVEDRILEAAALLTASSRLLCDELSARAGRAVELLPNAFDPRRFDPAVETPRPVDLRHGRPTIGFVGALWGEWVDLDLVRRLATALPDAAINLIGPAGSRPLPIAPNIVALGPRPQAAIPGYLREFDVALAPFTPGRLSAAVSPLKVFEALAMGRPVVASGLPELEGVPGVTLAGDPAEFVRAVVAAAVAPWPGAEVRRFLSGQTWAARVDRLLGLSGVAPP